VACRERGGLVEEEQFRVAAGCHEPRPTPAAKSQATGDPSLCSVEPANRSGVVVKAPAVAVHEPSVAGRDQISEGRDSVLKWHTSRLSGARLGLLPASSLACGTSGQPLRGFKTRGRRARRQARVALFAQSSTDDRRVTG
jgi:hypothetical protein